MKKGPASAEFRPDKSSLALIAIGISELVKSVLLTVLGIALVYWRNEDMGELASQWIDALWLSRPYFENLIARLSLMSVQTIEQFAAGSFAYSALLLIEGVGLCLRKRWAEFMTVGITASLLPFEIIELSHRMTPTAVIITLLNLAILWYLIAQLVKGRIRHAQMLD